MCSSAAPVIDAGKIGTGVKQSLGGVKVCAVEREMQGGGAVASGHIDQQTAKAIGEQIRDDCRLAVPRSPVQDSSAAAGPACVADSQGGGIDGAWPAIDELVEDIDMAVARGPLCGRRSVFVKTLSGPVPALSNKCADSRQIASSCGKETGM